MSVWYDDSAKRWRIRIRRDGREVNRYLPPGVTKRQAEEAHTAAMREFFDRSTLKKRPKRTIAEGITKYLTEYNVNNRRPEAALSVARQVIPLIAGKYLTDIPEVAEEIRALPGLKPATRNHRLCLLRRVCTLAFKQWEWLERPITIELLPCDNKRDVRLTPKDVERLAVAVGKRLPIAGDWVRIAAYSGLRRSEIMTVTRDSLVDGNIYLATSKNGKPRAVPIHPRIVEPLKRWVEQEPRWGLRWLYVNFERGRADAGMQDIHFHDLRHFFATQLVTSGVDLYTTGKILGHVDPHSTDRYTHLATEVLTKAVRKVK